MPEEAAEAALPPGEEALVAAELRARQGADQTSPRDIAAATDDGSGLPFVDAPAPQVVPRPDQNSAGGAVPVDAAVESFAIRGGGTATRTGDTSAVQFFAGAQVRGATAPAHVAQGAIASGQPVAAAILPPGAQGEADPSRSDADHATLRTIAGLRADAAPGVAAAAPEHPAPFTLFAGEGMRSDGDLPARRMAFPVDLSGDFAARRTATNAANSSSVKPMQGAPDPALAAIPAAQILPWAEITETAAQQASGGETALAPATTTGQTVRAYPVLFAAAEPQRVTQQIAEAVRRGTDGAIELALSPKELGSVRMSIQATETGTAIVMIAERDETMQLLRRHAEMLHDAFRDLGLGTLDLSFGGRDGKAARPDPRASGAPGFGLSEIADAPQQPTTPRMVSGGLDLRM